MFSETNARISKVISIGLVWYRTVQVATLYSITLIVLMQNASMVSLDGGSACKVDDVTALPSHIQDGGYALLRQRYDNNKMAAICYSTSSTVQS